MTTDSTDRRRWIALGLLATAQFVVVLDASIVTVTTRATYRGQSVKPCSGRPRTARDGVHSGHDDAR